MRGGGCKRGCQSLGPWGTVRRVDELAVLLWIGDGVGLSVGLCLVGLSGVVVSVGLSGGLCVFLMGLSGGWWSCVWSLCLWVYVSVFLVVSLRLCLCVYVSASLLQLLSIVYCANSKRPHRCAYAACMRCACCYLLSPSVRILCELRRLRV